MFLIPALGQKRRNLDMFTMSGLYAVKHILTDFHDLQVRFRHNRLDDLEKLFQNINPGDIENFIKETGFYKNMEKK